MAIGFRKVCMLLVGAVLLFGSATRLSAHERRQVGEYSFLVGWMVEPAYEGHMNGVDFRVNVGDGSGDPVTGLQDSIQVELTFDADGTEQTLGLRGLHGQPGRYTTNVIPTASGAYAFRFFGSIDGMQIDERFATYSIGGGFSDVESSADLQFPARLPEIRELEAAIRGLQSGVNEAQSAARTAGDGVSGASTRAMIALILAVISVGVSIAVALKARKAS